MKDIEIQALKTYNDNLQYFEQQHPELYKRLYALQSAIEQNLYVEKYSLEYTSDNYFDIRQLENNSFLYGQNSYLYSEKIADIVDLKKTGGVIEAQRFVEYQPGVPDIIDKSPLSFHNGLWATIKIIDYQKTHAAKNHTHMKKSYKAIFFHVGLGLHIPEILKKLNSKILFIHDENIEVFRLSLFVTPYFEICKDRYMFFSIMDDDINFRERYLSFLEKGYNYNLYIKYIPFFNHYEHLLEKLQNFHITQEHIYYPYNAFLLRYIDGPKYLSKNFSFLNISHRYDDSYFSEIPILFLFPGPSLSKNINWVKNNCNGYLTVAPLSACKFLTYNGISPNIIFHIDPCKEDAEKLLTDLDYSLLENTVIILSSNVHECVVDYFNRNQKYFIQQGVNYKDKFGSFSSPTVGEFAYAITLILGGSTLYLLGVDLALDSDTLISHSPLHPYIEQASYSETTQQNVDKNIVFVPGNFRSSVPTFSSYKNSISEFKRFSTFFKKPSQCVYNLSDGAFLEGSTPLSASKVPKQKNLNTDDTKLGIINFFNSISSAEFRLEDKKILKYQLKEAKKLLSIIYEFKKISYTDTEVYLKNISLLSSKLSNMSNKNPSDLSEVYYSYFKVVLSYIFDLFNTEELSEEIKHIKAINKILIRQLEKIGNTYIQGLEKYL